MVAVQILINGLCNAIWGHDDVIKGHKCFLATHASLDDDRNVKVVPMCSSRRDGSKDTQHDPPDLDLDLDLGQGQGQIRNWPFEVILYIIRTVLTRGTRWCMYRPPIFNRYAAMGKKLFSRNLTFWPLVTSFLTLEKKVQWRLDMISDELSNVFLIVSIRPIGAEIEGGVLNNPPPAGRGKSRGPAGRGLNHKY